MECISGERVLVGNHSFLGEIEMVVSAFIFYHADLGDFCG